MTPQTSPPSTPILPDLPRVNIPFPGSPEPVRPYELSPALVFIIGALGSILLVVGYYQIMLKYCSSVERLVSRRTNRHSRIRTSNEGPISNTGLDPSMIARIPVRPYNSKDADLGTECSVCLAEFTDGEAVRVLLKCRHAFHIPCIGIWLHRQSTCPVCRADVAMDFLNLIHSPRKDEQRPVIESLAQSSSLPLNGISQPVNANADRHARSLSRGEFPETESSSSQWYRRSVWSRRVTSPSRVRLYGGEPSDHNRNNGFSSHEVVIDLGEPSHR
ncbi:hypothetical protein SUGI_0034330 [Cryptomeria japonica]|uniref:RING-H2 finger protein ATL72-like n=1 Tax=Cryptomeria japonica TaxID=3369 RepID=UPI002408C9FA|nr:RING-H2 finger protein ATL72-like [Cryptomeria japonica]GLJ06249.1 hypothetical protein SUGI_0034330 [Cryptomeria japonica]